MATHDYVIANGTGAAVRSDLNGALAAIVSNNSSATAPATTSAYQWWADTTTGLLKIRNSANSAWVTIGTLASTNLGLLSLAGDTMTGVLAVTAGTAALPGIAVSGDPNTGIYSPGADQLAISTGGTVKATVDSSGRLLVGTSTYQGNSLLQVEGEAGAATAAGVLYLRRGLNTAAIGANVGADLGKIQWGANDGTIGAWIQCLSDATWSSTSDTPSALVFSTTADGAASPTPRMQIGSTGQSLFFTASTSSSVITRNGAAAGTSVAFLIGAYSATGLSDGTNSFIVWTNGNVVNTNNSYGAISDIKLKENIVDAGSQWADIKAFRVRKYNLKEGQKHTQIGGIAQEVELVSPGLVTESPDRDEEGNDLGTVTKSINYSVLYMKAVKALQEAMERIETLETRLSALEGA